MLYEGFGMIVGSARGEAAGCFRFRKSNCAAGAAGSRVMRCTAAADGCRPRLWEVQADEHYVSCPQFPGIGYAAVRSSLKPSEPRAPPLS